MEALTDLAVAVAIFAGLFVALEAGFRLGRRAAADPESKTGAGQVGAIQGAMLGLLGLLLAFSFAAAGGRFLERQDLIVTEANAIGTAYLRADLLDEPHRAGLRTALKDYTGHRVSTSAHLRKGVNAAAAAEIDALHARIWAEAIAGARARPEAMLAVLPPVNEVIDIHSLRIAAGRKHLPLLIMGLLIACSAISVGVIGYGCGLGNRRRALLSDSLVLLIAAALWITIDLDHPRAGLLQLSDAPLQSLKFEPGP